MHAATWVVSIVSTLEILNLHEQSHELIEALNIVNIDLEQSIHRLAALREFVHGDEMYRIPPECSILLRQDLTIASNDVASVLFKQAYESEIKLSVSLDRVSIVLHSLDKLTLLDVHRLHSVATFLFLKLVVHDLFEAHALEAKKRDQAIVVALVGQDVVAVHSIVVDVEFVEDHIGWCTHLQAQVYCDVLEAQMTIKSR